MGIWAPRPKRRRPLVDLLLLMTIYVYVRGFVFLTALQCGTAGQCSTCRRLVMLLKLLPLLMLDSGKACLAMSAAKSGSGSISLRCGRESFDVKPFLCLVVCYCTCRHWRKRRTMQGPTRPSFGASMRSNKETLIFCQSCLVFTLTGL